MLEQVKKTTKIDIEKDNIYVGQTKSVEKSEEKRNVIYLDLFCCKINIWLIFTFICIFTGALLNVINRRIFYNYSFLFNLNIFLFICIGIHSETFIKHAGKISFSNFSSYKYHYFFHNNFRN